jgi:hypothetical protein
MEEVSLVDAVITSWKEVGRQLGQVLLQDEQSR